MKAVNTKSQADSFKKALVQIEVVLGLVKSKENKVLFTIRREKKMKDGHLKVQLPGGTPRKGEHPHKTAEREVYEETGWKVKAKHKFPFIYEHYWDYPDKIQRTLIHCVLCEPLEKGKFYQKMQEDAFWAHIDEAHTLDLLPGNKDFIDLLDRP